MECKSCASLAGTQRISPGETIYNGAHWVLEHAYPTKVRGWLVLVLKRHATAMHELSVHEFAEFQELMPKIIAMLHTSFGCTKEYILCLAESEGFEHVHVHIVPRASDLPVEFRGTKIFGLMAGEGRIPEEEVVALCKVLQRAL